MENRKQQVKMYTSSMIDQLKSFDPLKGAGLDDISHLLIINCAESFVKPLLLLFIRSLVESIVPEIGKSAFVTPKIGDRNSIRNYRTIISNCVYFLKFNYISKLCIFSKIFERIVYQLVYPLLSLSFIPE